MNEKGIIDVTMDDALLISAFLAVISELKA